MPATTLLPLRAAACFVLATIAIRPAQAFDVKPKTGITSIEVTHRGQKAFFRFCDDRIKPQPCRPLGNPNGTSLADIRSQRFVEAAQATGVTIGHAVLLLVTLGLADVAWAAADMGVSAAAPYIITVAGIGAMKLITLANAADPITQWRQFRMVTYEIIEDQDVVIGDTWFSSADERIARMAEALDTVLKKVD